MRVINIIKNAAVQAACYISEMTTVSVLLMSLSTYLSPIRTIPEIWYRIAVSYIIYQLIVYNVLSCINSSQERAYSDYATALRKAAWYVESPNIPLRREILIRVEHHLNNEFFTNNELREKYITLRECLGSFTKRQLELELIRAEKIRDDCPLQCRYSLFIRLLTEFLNR